LDQFRSTGAISTPSFAPSAGIEFRHRASIGLDPAAQSLPPCPPSAPSPHFQPAAAGEASPWDRPDCSESRWGPAAYHKR